jgi:hypothetical protein
LGVLDPSILTQERIVMAKSSRPSGPRGAERPFTPNPDESDPAERIARALEHIAVVLSAIDTNLEKIAREIPKARL